MSIIATHDLLQTRTSSHCRIDDRSPKRANVICCFLSLSPYKLWSFKASHYLSNLHSVELLFYFVVAKGRCHQRRLLFSLLSMFESSQVAGFTCFLFLFRFLRFFCRISDLPNFHDFMLGFCLSSVR